jgi:hypothetical protein
MHVYPDPNGGSNSNAYVPSDTRLAGAAIASGAVAVGAAAPAVGSALITSALTFLQTAPSQTAGADRVLGVIHGLGAGQVAVILIFGSLSVLLQVVNLLKGYRMKERLRRLSDRVCQECAKAGGVFDWWRTAK